MATKTEDPTVPPLAPRRDEDTVAEMTRAHDLVDQRADDIRERIEKVDAKINKLHRERVELTQELASVWHAT